MKVLDTLRSKEDIRNDPIHLDNTEASGNKIDNTSYNNDEISNQQIIDQTSSPEGSQSNLLKEIKKEIKKNNSQKEEVQSLKFDVKTLSEQVLKLEENNEVIRSVEKQIVSLQTTASLGQWAIPVVIGIICAVMGYLYTQLNTVSKDCSELKGIVNTIQEKK